MNGAAYNSRSLTEAELKQLIRPEDIRGIEAKLLEVIKEHEAGLRGKNTSSSQASQSASVLHDMNVSFTWDHEFRLKFATSLADYVLKAAGRTGNAELRQLCINRAYKDLIDRGF